MAARFWVGGSGTWNAINILNWSATSGGVGGASAPTTADTVTFDANSGTAATVSVAATAACSTCTVNKADINLSLTGSPTFTSTFTLTTGTVTLNSFTLTCSQFSSSNTNARTIAFGTGNIAITGTGTVWNTDTMTGLTVTGTPIVNATNSGSTARSIIAGNAAPGTEANSISFNVTAGTDTLALYSRGLRDVDFTGFAGTWAATGSLKTFYGSLTLSTGMTLAAGIGTFTFAATSGTKTITTNGKTIDGAITFDGVGGTFQLVDNLTMGSTRTATLTNGTLDLNGKTLTCNIFLSSNANVRTIAFGVGNITVTGNNATVWSTDTSTNLTVTGTPVVNFTYSGSTGTRVAPFGNLAAPSEVNAISVNVSAGSDALSMYGAGFRDINFTGFSGTWNAVGAAKTLYGSLTLSTGMALAASIGTLTFAATSGTKTITTNGKTIDGAITFNGVGSTFSFADALTQGSTRAFTITNGTVKMKAGTTNTVGSFATGGGTTQRYLQSTTAGTQATLTAPSGTFTATYLTIQDSAAAGGATWNAFVTNNNVDAGNNSGWNFGLTPQYAYEYPIELRSFTERMRF